MLTLYVYQYFTFGVHNRVSRYFDQSNAMY